MLLKKLKKKTSKKYNFGEKGKIGLIGK